MFSFVQLDLTLPSLNGSVGAKCWFIRVDDARCILCENATHVICICFFLFFFNHQLSKGQNKLPSHIIRRCWQHWDACGEVFRSSSSWTSCHLQTCPVEAAFQSGLCERCFCWRTIVAEAAEWSSLNYRTILSLPTRIKTAGLWQSEWNGAEKNFRKIYFHYKLRHCFAL